jgi:hypothetical protein
VLSFAPNNAGVHYWLGFVQVGTNRALQGIAECERALALDPNMARAHALMGMGKISAAAPMKPSLMSTRRSGFLPGTTSRLSGC